MSDLSYKEFHSLLDDAFSSSLLASPTSSSSSSLTSRFFSLPRILLMGTRRAGKTSIARVIFQKLAPHETLFLESTSEVRVKEIRTSQFMQFLLFDLPGNFDFTSHHQHQKKGAANSSSSPSSSSASSSADITPEQLFNKNTTIVFVIDAQDDQNDFNECVDYLISVLKIAASVQDTSSSSAASSIAEHLKIEIFLHKFDGDLFVDPSMKSSTFSEIKQTLLEELAHDPYLVSCGLATPTFHATSIYDHSLYSAFSLICSCLIFSLSLLENLLDSVLFHCDLEKIFLFDVVSKIYLASDSNPIDMNTVELSSDMIDVMCDVIHIYGSNNAATNSLSSPPAATISTSSTSTSSALTSSTSTSEEEEGDSSTGSMIELSNGYVLYYCAVSQYLSLVSLMRSSSWHHRRGLIDYNFHCLRQAIQKIIAVKEEAQSKEEGREREKRRAAAASHQNHSSASPAHQNQSSSSTIATAAT